VPPHAETQAGVQRVLHDTKSLNRVLSTRRPSAAEAAISPSCR
jgi:hypothetical protein